MEIRVAVSMIQQEYERLHDLWFGSRVNYPLATLKFVYIPDNPDDMADVRGDVTARAATPPDFNWGYDYKTHILQCVIRESDLDETSGMRCGMIDMDEGETPNGVYQDSRIAIWSYWRWNLVHEMCHEYEHKLLNGEATLQGWTLFDTNRLQQHKRIWPEPRQHPVTFYSAIASFAAQFTLNVDLLHDQI